MRTETGINLIGLFLYLIKRSIFVLATMFLFAAVTLVCCKSLVVPRYTASARVYVLSRSEADSLAYSDLQLSSQLASDFAVLITGENITSAVIAQLGLNLTPIELANSISVSNPEGTRVLQMNVTLEDPQLAADVANCILDTMVRQMVPIIGTDAFHVIYEAAVPTEPSSPNITQNGWIAAVLGFLISTIVLVVRYTMRPEKDAEAGLRADKISRVK